jgi:hypothetical protein
MPIRNANLIKANIIAPSESAEHQEKALDDALENTFPASDPISIEQPTPPAADQRPEGGVPYLGAPERCCG